MQAELLISLRMSLTVSLLFLLFISGVVAQDGWAVNYNHKSICALKGSTVTIECTYTYPSGHSVQKAFWTKQWGQGSEPPDLLDDPEYRGRVQYLGDKQHSCNLRLSDVTEEDQSKYYFRFITDQPGGSWQGAGGVDLSVTDGPKSVSVSISPSGEIVEGSSVTLTCSSDAESPVQSYTWFKGSSLVAKGETYTVNKISSVDSGEYKCRSSNEHGEKLSEALTLNVLYPPKSISVSISPSGEIVEGSSVNLTCSSDANPPVKNYTWFKKLNKGALQNSKRQTYSISYINSADSGEYQCMATNTQGSQYSEYKSLTVLYAPNKVWVSISETAEGSSVTLTCSSDANPPVQNYTWFKEGGSSPVGSGHSYRALQSGSYYCVAQNEYRSQKSAAVTVTEKGVGKSALYAVIGVIAVRLSVFFAVFYVRRKRRVNSADDANQKQNVDPNAKDDTYTALDPVSRSSDDVYNTLTTVHSSPSDDLYSALDPQSRSPEYDTLAILLFQN
ncbi:B-cell receptor CD22-like isoform X2 [Colossoma macropomum]|uniref:B-cell receptor CD22-like isoform X2 n=1 Tax=Colossoma macropomum TaxID=42526 RepID=UPI00186469A2|nr:B-cell receptor CD22-like isoform X2 [Colossoma macropomum]